MQLLCLQALKSTQLVRLLVLITADYKALECRFEHTHVGYSQSKPPYIFYSLGQPVCICLDAEPTTTCKSIIKL